LKKLFFKIKMCSFITFWKSPKGALVLMLMSAIFFTLMAVYGKEAIDRGFAWTELILLRSSGQAIVLTFPLSYFQKISLLPPKSARGLVALGGIITSVGSVCYFKALQCLRIGDAISLFSIYPVVTVGFSIPLLGEKLTVNIIIAVFLSIAGALCIAQPHYLFGNGKWTNSGDTSDCEWFGYVVALFGSFCGGLLLIIIKMIGNSAHIVHLLFSQFVFQALTSILLHIIDTDWVLPGEDDMWDILLVILFGTVAHLMMNYAGTICHAGAGSIMRSTDVLWGYLWQITVFDVLPDPLAVIGAVLVLLSALVVGQAKEKKVEFEYITIVEKETPGAAEGIEAMKSPTPRDIKDAVKYIN